MATNTMNDLLDRLNRIAAALDNRRPTPGQAEAEGRQVAELLDYLVLRELMGRRFGETRVVAASRQANPAVLVVRTIPTGATEVLVFTGQADGNEVLAQTIDLTKPYGRTTTQFALDPAVDGKEISRLVFRTADHLPIALGPRLNVV